MSESTVTLRAVIKDEVSAALRGISGATKGLGDDAKTSGASFGALDAEVAKLSSALQDNVIKLRAQRDLLKDPVYSESARHAAALRKEINSLTDGLDGSSREGGKNATSWANVAAKYYVASQAVGVLSSGIMSLVDASKQYEMIRARLNAAEGSSALGGQDFRDAQEMAKKPGLGFQEAATTMATLRGMKITANEAKQLINGIAQANASAAGTAEQFGRVMYQIQQSVSTGRLMAEDLRPIMQAIPTLGAAIQEHFGASQAEALNDKLKASGKSVREFWLEVSELGQKLPSTGDTITNNLDNISDGWVRLRAALSDADAIKTATGLLAKFLEVSSQAVEGASARKALKKRAETNLGQVSVGYATAGIDDVVGNQSSFAIEEEMIRLRQLDFLKANNEAYDKEIKEDQERWDAAVKRDREAEAARKADARKRDGESEAKRMAAHNRASEANIETNFDGSVTLRSGIEYETQDDTEHARNREKAERADEKRAEKDEKLRQKLADVNEKITKQEETTKKAHLKVEAVEFAVTERRKSDTLKEELGRREAMYDKYAGQVQGLAQNQLASALRGEFSLTEARRAAFETSTNMAAQWVTESIARYIKKSIFEKEQMAVDAAAANAARAAGFAAANTARAAEFAASSATAAATFMAWAPAAGAVTAATFGANADAGAVQYAAMQGIISASAMMPHARGGAVFGRASASREEAFIPLTPGRVVPAHNSVTNNSSTSNSVNHFHFHGADEKTILRTLRKAGIDNRNVSRS